MDVKNVISTLYRFATSRFSKKLCIFFLRIVAKQSENTIDDEIVNELEKRFKF